MKNKLNIGCGQDIREGYVNIDFIAHPNVDFVHNLNNIPYPFEDNRFDEILCRHVLEHLNPIKLTEVLKELHRITKPGGRLMIQVPHFSDAISKYHATHFKLFGVKTFDVFCDNNDGIEKYLEGYFDCISSKINVKTRWAWLVRLMNEDRYERIYCCLFPASEVLVELKVLKENNK